jgi:hypothetical protein
MYAVVNSLSNRQGQEVSQYSQESLTYFLKSLFLLILTLKGSRY